MTDPWGKVDITTWKALPHLRGRVATEDDVLQGRAVFHMSSGNKAADVELPFCAIQESDDDEPVPVVAIQAEEVNGQVIMGIRYLEGGNGICMISELKILEAPNEMF